MNTKTLAKHYDKLRPRERLPLIVAATARDDEQEGNRLANSAPRNGYRLPDYHGLADALQDLALVHMLSLLDLAAQYWHVSGILESHQMLNEMLPKAQQDNATADRMCGITRMLAYVFVVNLDAWRQLMAELQIVSDVLLKCMPGYSTVERLEPLARESAFTAEEAAAYLNKTCQRKSRETEGRIVVEVVPVTVESEVANMRKFLSEREEWWG